MFGWTFNEFDEQPTDEVLQYLQLRRIAKEIISRRQDNGG